jgi:hypothetical protein
MAFHIIFPSDTIGLASYLAVLEGLWLWKKDTTYRDLYHFWSHLFAVNFAMGVVSGIVMAYRFRTTPMAEETAKILVQNRASDTAPCPCASTCCAGSRWKRKADDEM